MIKSRFTCRSELIFRRGIVYAIAYADEEGRRTSRTIWPLAMAYYVDVTLLGAWCELRSDFRNFRVDRILASQVLDKRFPVDKGKLMTEWLALRKERPDRPIS